MQEVWPSVLTSALGVAASPLPIVAVIIILLTRRAAVSSIIFLTAWVVGNAAAITIAISFAGRITSPPAGLDLESEGIITVLFGVGLVATAVLSRRGRFRSEDPTAAPRWVAAVDNLSPLGGALVALSNAMTSPKNLALAISAGLAISQARLLPSQETTAATVYVLVASTTILLPVAVYFIGGDRSRAVLTRWKRNITARAAAIMEVLMFGFGLALTLKGLYNLFL